MKTYEVIAIMTTPCKLIIKAHSEEEALEIAQDTDGGDFVPDDINGSWHIECAKEIKVRSKKQQC